MSKKKFIIIVSLILSFVLHCLIYTIRDNYLLGREIRMEAGDLLQQCDQVKRSIDYLEQQFNNGSTEVDRSYFDLALHSLRYFGYDNMPVLDDVRCEWSVRLEQLYRKTMSDEELRIFFTENKEEVDFWQTQLQNLNDHFNVFIDRYGQMSKWEQHFVSWRNERRILSDKVKISA